MRSVMKHDFSKNPSMNAPRSMFDLSHGHKFTFDGGYLIPFLRMDVLPGDTFNLNTTAFVRMSTPLYPVMDNCYVDTHFFFCPMRLVWDNARKFFGEQANPSDSIDYTIPKFSSFTPTEASLHDYLGLPVRSKAMTPVSIYHRGYNLIWNEWFRDQNLQNSVTVDTDDGTDTPGDYVLLKRGKRHDYFTSCLTNPQKGDAVDLPLGTSAPIYTDMDMDGVDDTNNNLNVYKTQGGSLGELGVNGSNIIGNSAASGSKTIYADLTNATAATINDIREAFQVQKLLERDAMGGTRYSELVSNHFGVNFYDVSYRPEFLGGGTSPVNINPVARTTENATAGTNTGELGAVATAGFTDHGFTKSFVEHGFIIGIMSVRADLTYQQGMHRDFTKSTRYDIYWPSLAHLGNQEVYNKEIYFNADANDDLVFGYQERYAEYRYHPSRISGAFRSEAATPLDAWHWSEEFSTLPTLGATFIDDGTPWDRAMATPSEPNFIADTYTHVRAARPMPVYGVPGYVDHF